MPYAANRNRGSSLQSASGPTLGLSSSPSGASLLHTLLLSSGPLPLHWDLRFRGLIDAQDQLLTDFFLRPRSRPLGGPWNLQIRGIQKTVHVQWKSNEQPSLSCKLTAPRPERTKQSQCSELVFLPVLKVVYLANLELVNDVHLSCQYG